MGNDSKYLKKIQKYGDLITNHTFKLSGDRGDCVSIIINYCNHVPVDGSFIFSDYDYTCRLGTVVNRGIGSILMIKTLLRYIHSKYPLVTKFTFTDMSNIECIIDHIQPSDDDSHIIPLPLNLLSIAYNGKTWYEHYFNAEYTDPDRQKKYREKIQFLYNPEEKLTFLRFLEVASPPIEQTDYLKDKYISASTYHEFFNSIPKDDRCIILRPWLQTFMKYYFKDIFSNYDWVINITKMNQLNGGKRKTRKRTRSKNKPYYIPKGIIVYSPTI